MFNIIKILCTLDFTPKSWINDWKNKKANFQENNRHLESGGHPPPHSSTYYLAQRFFLNLLIKKWINIELPPMLLGPCKTWNEREEINFLHGFSIFIKKKRKKKGFCGFFLPVKIGFYVIQYYLVHCVIYQVLQTSKSIIKLIKNPRLRLRNNLFSFSFSHELFWGDIKGEQVTDTL